MNLVADEGEGSKAGELESKGGDEGEEEGGREGAAKEADVSLGS